MSVQSLEAQHSDVDEIVSVIFATYEDPVEPFVAISFPGLGSSTPSREQGKRNAAEQLLAGWKTNPNEHWMKVVDSKTEEIIRQGVFN